MTPTRIFFFCGFAVAGAVWAYAFHTLKQDRVYAVAATAETSAHAATPEPLVPWIEEAKAGCRMYDMQPNDIRKSDVFRTQKDFPIGKRVDGAHGKLVYLRTDHGGDVAHVVVDVSGAKLATSSARGTPMYEAVSQLQEGQCVALTAAVKSVESIRERSVMCDLEYAAAFEAIESCPTL